MNKKRTIIRFNGYEIVCRAVEQGVSIGFNRGMKHSDEQISEQLKAGIINQIENEVMNAICEVVIFDEGD